jgi:phosphate transport system protein
VDFERGLARLQEELLEMGSMVDKAIARAIDALKRGDTNAAGRIIREDDAIDRKRAELEEQCIEIIATQAPVARDLRMVIAVYAIAGELERVGDYAEGIAKITIMMGGAPPLKPLIDIPIMADKGRAMLRKSLDALVERNIELAKEVSASDDEVDLLYNQVYRELLSFMIEDPRTIQRATHLLWVAHDLERIADRATNIAEGAVFMVTGETAMLNVPKTAV